MHKTAVVAGGGAAGFFCAVTAARLNPDLKVILVEKSGKLLSKVKISGGGRCNVTHACFSIDEMARRYPRGANFVKKTFYQFFTTDTIQWFAERGVPLITEPDGRMFPSTHSSQTIIDCLLQEATKYGVEIRMHHEIKSFVYDPEKRNFDIAFGNGLTLQSDFLTLASGGYPKATMFGWISPTGHRIEPPVPSLFTFNMPDHPVTALMGISVPEATVKIAGTSLKERGPLLITHWGMSGPAILKLSAWGARILHEKEYHFEIRVNWLGEQIEAGVRNQILEMRESAGGKKVRSGNPWALPQRLWEWLLDQSGITDMRWADLPSTLQNKLVANLTNQYFPVKGKTTFKEEFVSAGGIDLSGIDHQRMESHKIPGLFFAGELLDVDGITGGFNFQNAWTTGFISGRAMATEP